MYFQWAFFVYQAKIKRQSKDEKEKFFQEILRFNCDFSLHGNRETMVESQTHTQILDLEREVESLYKGHKTQFTVILSQ